MSCERATCKLDKPCLIRAEQKISLRNKFDSMMPKWAGEKSTVLLNLEGGVGDQIHGYRYAWNIAAKARRVIVSCSSELAPLFAEDFPVVQHEAALGVYHDHWVPSMSAVRPLGYEYSDLDGSSYMQRTAQTYSGACWSSLGWQSTIRA